MTCNVVWLRQALAEYQNRLNNVLLVISDGCGNPSAGMATGQRAIHP